MFLKTVLVTAFFLIGFSSVLRAEQWGDLSLRIMYNAGPVPVPTPIAVGGIAACAVPLVREDLLVNAKDRGVANVVVYLLPGKGQQVPVHPEYEKTARDEAFLTIKNCRFEPHVAVMRTSQAFNCANADAIGHNAKSEFTQNTLFNVLIPAGKSSNHSLPKPESYPTPISCSIYPWMTAYLFVSDNPYAAVSDVSGNIKISKIPAGTWTFVLWHERAGYIHTANIGGKEVRLRRGQLVQKIDSENIDLGDFLIDPAIFK